MKRFDSRGGFYTSTFASYSAPKKFIQFSEKKIHIIFSFVEKSTLFKIHIVNSNQLAVFRIFSYIV